MIQKEKSKWPQKKSPSKKGQPKSTDLSKVQYFKCHEYGYYTNSPDCPKYREPREEENDSDEDDLGDDWEGDMNMSFGLDLKPNDFPSFQFVQMMIRELKAKNGKPKYLMIKILLDSQANINMFCNPHLLTRIRKGPREMTLHC